MNARVREQDEVDDGEEDLEDADDGEGLFGVGEVETAMTNGHFGGCDGVGVIRLLGRRSIRFRWNPSFGFQELFAWRIKE